MLASAVIGVVVACLYYSAKGIGQIQLACDVESILRHSDQTSGAAAPYTDLEDRSIASRLLGQPPELIASIHVDQRGMLDLVPRVHERGILDPRRIGGKGDYDRVCKLRR